MGAERQGWRAMWVGDGGSEMTSSVGHSASAPAGESQGGVYGAASCNRRGTNCKMHEFIVRGQLIFPEYRHGGVGTEEGSPNWEAGEQQQEGLCCVSLNQSESRQ